MLVTLRGMCHRLTMSSLDVLLDGPRAERAFLLKAVFAGTWSITVEDRVPRGPVVPVEGRRAVSGGDPDGVASSGQEL